MNEHIKSRTKREQAECQLLQVFKNIKIFEPEKHCHILTSYSDCSFGFSSAAFSLYSNGMNPRGKSRIAPFGLLYHDGIVVFSIGYFRKEGQREDEDGYLMIVAPKGNGASEKVALLAEGMLKTIQCKGVCVRFLDEKAFSVLKEMGFTAAAMSPWHPLAPQEDETFCHSDLKLSRVINHCSDNFEVLDLSDAQDKEHRRKSRLAFRRFGNFLKRNRLSFKMEKLRPTQSETARSIVKRHFSLLKEPVGSIAEDHFGIVSPEILALPNVRAYMGYLNDLPISVFVGEKIAQDTVALYTPMTLRSAADVLPALGLDPEEMVANLGELRNEPGKVQRKQGFSAVALFNQLNYFAKLAAEGLEHVKLGGSEKKELDDEKRQLGATEDQTYWAVKLRQNMR